MRADICITPFLAFVFLRKSTLLNIISDFCVCRSFGRSVSLSKTCKIKSAFSMLFFVLLTPSFSTGLLESLKPAVSMNRMGAPSIISSTSIKFLVVPGVLFTIERSPFARQLNNVDFPTFGFPVITTLAPLNKSLPSLYDPNKSLTEFFVFFSSFMIFLNVCFCVSSSEMSISFSTTERTLITPLFISASFLESPPSTILCWARAASLDLALINEATPSTCIKSILPFIKARRVNSPGSASRAPNEHIVSMISVMIEGFP